MMKILPLTIAALLVPSFILTSAEAAPKKGAKAKNGANIVKVDSKDGSFYYMYKPPTALTEGKIPVFFWTSAGKKGDEKSVSMFLKGAELTGMTVIACGNSSNRTPNNSVHIDNNLKHATKTEKIDDERLFFGGTSGGAQRSLRNATKYDCAGGMPVVGYLAEAKPKKGDYYVISGAYDYNRYASAYVAKAIGSSAIHRMVPGGHSCNDLESLNDGIIWLYTKNAYLRKKASNAEREQFEERFYKYLAEELSSEPWRAYYWTDHMLNTVKMSGANKSKFKELHSQLAADEKNELYLEGREELIKISSKHLSGVTSGSRYGHTTKSIAKEAKKIAEKYGSIPRLKVIANDLAKKTDK